MIEEEKCEYIESTDDEQLIQKLNEEREQIFKLYDDSNKLQTSVVTDESKFVIDTFGFIHDNISLPSNGHLTNLSKSRFDSLAISEQLSEKVLKKLKNREKKWSLMLIKWQKVQEKTIRKRVFKGIPKSVRAVVWKLLLGVDKVKENNPNVYTEMLKMARKYSNDARQIDLDVNRQFRDNIDYKERYSVKQKSLFHVLVAYAMYNTEVGYCQGMSCIVAILLTYLPIEEDAFWALSILFSEKKYGMHGFFVEGFPKLIRFLNHQDFIVRKFLPKLKKHFDKHGLDPIIYALKWYLVCFTERVPFSLCLRIWDIFLLEGDRVLIAMAFTILKLHSKAIIDLKDMDTIINYLQGKLSRDFGYSDDKVIKALQKTMEELTEKKFDVPLTQASDKELPKKPFGIIDEAHLKEKLISKTQNIKLTRDLISLKKNPVFDEESKNTDNDYCESDEEDKAIVSNTESSVTSPLNSTPILSTNSVSRNNQRPHMKNIQKETNKKCNNQIEKNGNNSRSTAINAEQVAIPMSDQVHYVLRIEVNQSPNSQKSSNIDSDRKLLSNHSLKVID